MPSLDTILDTGMFAQSSDGTVFPTMVSMQEQLVAQEFAREINSGRLDIIDALEYFWTPLTEVSRWYFSTFLFENRFGSTWMKVLNTLGGLLDEAKVEYLIDWIQPDYLIEQDKHARYKQREIIVEIVYGNTQKMKERLLHIIKDYVDKGGKKRYELIHMLRLRGMNDEIMYNATQPPDFPIEKLWAYDLLGFREPDRKEQRRGNPTPPAPSLSQSCQV